jgi:hypothetical protein
MNPNFPLNPDASPGALARAARYVNACAQHRESRYCLMRRNRRCGMAFAPSCRAGGKKSPDSAIHTEANLPAMVKSVPTR